MKTKIILLLLLLNTPIAYAEGQFSIHLVTGHIGINNLETVTPGIAYTEKGYRAGVIRNSFRLPSFYAAKLYDINHRLRFGLGIITGYSIEGLHLKGDTSGVIPLLAAEFDINNQLSILFTGRAFNLELKF